MLEERTGIMCFGDSNTWGYVPKVIGDTSVAKRYDQDTRWTGILSKLLGQDFVVYEQGMSGRTTIYDVPGEAYRIGAPQLLPCLYTCAPLSLVVLMLGTNDLVLTANPPCEGKLAEGVLAMGRSIQQFGKCGKNGIPPQILLVSPALVNTKVETLLAANRLSRLFAQEYKQAAEQLGCGFLDAAQYTRPSEVDGVHLEPESHRALSHAIAKKVLEMLK